jgi:CHASE2 domain-containing sensor protein
MGRETSSGWLPQWLPAVIRSAAPGPRWSPSSLRAALLLAVVVVGAVTALGLQSTGALSGLEAQTVDARFAIRGRQPTDRRIAIVALDQNTLKQLNVSYPIPRRYFAPLLDRLRAANPRVIGLDFEFSGVNDEPAGDRAMLAAISRDRPVLMGAPDPLNGFRPLGATSAPGAVLASQPVDYSSPDAVIRKLAYIDVTLQTFAVRAAEIYTGHTVNPANFPGDLAWVDFRGPPHSYPTYSFASVLAGKVPASAFAGKVVLVGVTDPIAKDVFLTSISSKPMSGVEVWANSLSTILDGFPVRSSSGFINVVLIILLAALPAVLALRLEPLYLLLGSIVTIVVYLVATQLAFDGGSIIPVVNPIIGLLLVAAGSVGAESLVDTRRRSALEHALQGFLRPVRTGFFISYRRDQGAFVANSLRNALIERFGTDSVFMDTHTIKPGQEWPREILEYILGASFMLVLIGPYWLEARDSAGGRRLDDPGDWVRLEIEAGLRRPGLAIVPLLFDGAKMPSEQALPESLRPLAQRHAIPLLGENVNDEIDELVEAIEGGRIRSLLAPPRASRILCLIGSPTRRFTISSAQVIGSGADADIVLDGAGVAPHHARVSPGIDGLMIEDLSSGSGTWVNGTRLSGPQEVSERSAIKIGSSMFVVESAAQARPVQPPHAARALPGS